MIQISFLSLLGDAFHSRVRDELTISLDQMWIESVWCTKGLSAAYAEGASRGLSSPV